MMLSKTWSQSARLDATGPSSKTVKRFYYFSVHTIRFQTRNMHYSTDTHICMTQRTELQVNVSYDSEIEQEEQIKQTVYV